jgi:hypothetical protein
MALIARNKRAFMILGLILILITTGCATPTPVIVIITQPVPQTVIVTQVVTKEVTPIPSLTSIPQITPTVTSAVADFDFYYPFSDSDCGLSIVHVGDRVYVNFGGTTNALRSTPDNRYPTNITGYVIQGETLDVTDGPICSFGIIMWKVKTSASVSGWTAEGNGTDFWIIPQN